jgi:hypothetical protein
MAMRIVANSIALEELRAVAKEQFGDFVKAVVDIGHGVMAVGGELHADEEALLLERGAVQRNLWGVNLYPDRPPAEWIEFDSMINVRPSQGNRSRGVDDPAMRETISAVVERLVVR